MTENLFKVLKVTQENISGELEMGIKFGKWIMIEKVGQELSPELEPVLCLQKKKKGAGWVIKMGEKEID